MNHVVLNSQLEKWIQSSVINKNFAWDMNMSNCVHSNPYRTRVVVVLGLSYFELCMFRRKKERYEWNFNHDAWIRVNSWIAARKHVLHFTEKKN